MSYLAKGALKSHIDHRSVTVRGGHERERYPPRQLSLAGINCLWPELKTLLCKREELSPKDLLLIAVPVDSTSTSL